MSDAASPPQRLKSLDLLRLGLSLLIMLTHARRLFEIEVPVWLTKGLLDGKGGVVLFFVLSGHVLTRSLKHVLISWDAGRQFLIKRVFRLFPLYWVALVITFAILTWIKSTGADGPVTFLRQDGPGWGQWLLHSALLVPGMQSDFALPTVWSLMTESKVSLLAFPIFGWAMLRLPPWCVVGLTAMLVFGSDFLFTHVIGTAAYLGIFALGGLLARVPEGWWRRVPVPGWWALLLAGCAAYSCMSLRYRLPNVWMGYYLCAGGGAAIIACVSYWTALSRRMHSLQSRIGVDLSYGIYLLHYPMLLAFCQFCGASEVFHPLLAQAAMVATVALAWFLAHAVEIPMSRLGRQLAGGRSTRSIADTATGRPSVRDVSS
jgi:exopolysaccharide production protein ExoZ